MKKHTYILILSILCFLPGGIAAGNPQPSKYQALLESLFTRILNTNSDSIRISLNDSVRVLIDSYTASDSVIDHKFNKLRYLGQIKSPDSKVKIITWNLPLRESANKYFCYIIKKGARGGKNTLYKLYGENRDETPDTNRNYSAKDWYGALYYAIEPFSSGKELHYLLLGLDYGNSMITRKIIDVLTFTKSGDIVFGNNCFSRGNTISSRVIIEYSSEGVITLRLHNPKLVVFDRLAPISDDKKDDPGNMGSEYSFDGYRLKKGLWRFVSNLDVRNRKK
jgi:hypothetical protein